MNSDRVFRCYYYLASATEMKLDLSSIQTSDDHFIDEVQKVLKDC